jgi:aminoglycoside phosphotransferase (APT) family kinase protein
LTVTVPAPASLDFDPKPLEAWFASHIEHFEGPLEVLLLTGGQSNPTYRIKTPYANYVLRRRPPGVLISSAHAVDREYRVISALSPGALAPVPNALAYCDDDGVIGTSFYVMSWVDGRVFQDPQLPSVTPVDRRSYWQSAVDALAQIHTADWRAAGLAGFGRPDGYLERQIDRWTKLYRSDPEAGRIPIFERVIEWLSRHLPSSTEAVAIIHGDYRMDNVMFHRVKPEVVAVLDWELATLGNPLADFAYFLMIYRMPSLAFPGLRDVDLNAALLPAEAEIIARYCERTGRPASLPDLDYYIVFSLFRLTAIFHGIRGRLLRGTAASPRARDYASHVETLADLAWQQSLRAEAGYQVPALAVK